MAFGANAFKSAMGSPMGGSTPPAGAPKKPGLDLEGLMAPPGGPGEIGEPGDSEAEEGSETSLEAALEQAGIQADPDQINKIKEILGIAGGAVPGMGEEEGGLPPPPAAPTSKLGKMFGAGK